MKFTSRRYQPRKVESRMPILVCECGNKYIKTRTGQVKCVVCINRLAKEDAR